MIRRTDPMNPRLAEDLIRVGLCIGVWAGVGFVAWQGLAAAVGFAVAGTVLTAGFLARHRRVAARRGTP